MGIKKYLPIIIITLAIFVFGSIIVRKLSKPTIPVQKTFQVPQGGKKINDNIYDFGETEDINGKKVRKIMIVDHPKAQNEKVKGASTGVLQASSDPCYNESIGGTNNPSRNYELHPLTFDPQNSSGLTQNDTVSALNRSVYKWEGAAKFNFLDNPTTGNLPPEIVNNTDGKNEILFAAVIDSQLADALGITFSYFDALGNISESDMIINDSRPFTINGDTNKYDFESVLTHETGHFAGLTDLTDLACSQEIMFGFQGRGEIKRNLTINDETSVYSLYHPPISLSNPPPASLRYPVIEDSFVNATSPTQNFGSLDFLETNSSPNKSSFLKFDLLNLNGQQISKATLNLRIMDPSSNLQTAKQSLSAWGENSINFQNLPVIKSQVSSFRGTTTNTSTTLDITSFVNNNKGKIVTLQITSGGSDNLSFMSRNSAVFSPFIQIEFTNGQGNPKPGDCGGPDGTPDGFVDLFDYGNLSRSFGITQGQPGFNAACDFYQDAHNIIDLLDYGILAQNFGR